MCFRYHLAGETADGQGKGERQQVIFPFYFYFYNLYMPTGCTICLQSTDPNTNMCSATLIVACTVARKSNPAFCTVCFMLATTKKACLYVFLLVHHNLRASPSALYLRYLAVGAVKSRDQKKTFSYKTTTTHTYRSKSIENLQSAWTQGEGEGGSEK